MTLETLLYPRRDDEVDMIAAYKARPLNRDAFAQEGTRQCPKCSEENLAEAKMCWSCFRPLPDENYQQGAGREWANREWEKLVRETKRRERIEKAKCAVRLGLFLGGIAAITSSGYFPSDSIALIGLGWILFLVLWGWFKWDERIAARQASLEGDPVERILDTILLYAGRDGASQIRFRAGINVQVHYFIEGTWHEQMAIPAYIWEPLYTHLLAKTNDWKTPILYTLPEKSFEFWPEFERNYELPLATLILTLHWTV